MRTIWKNQSTLGLEPATSRSQWSNLPLVELRLLTSDPFQILRWWEPHVLFSGMISLFCHFIPDTTLFVPLFFNWWKALGRQKPVVSGSYSIKSCACNIFYNCFFLQNDMAEWPNITKETRREASAICQSFTFDVFEGSSKKGGTAHTSTQRYTGCNNRFTWPYFALRHPSTCGGSVVEGPFFQQCESRSSF